ncbi:MAG TPA: DUF4097 family beta strand repeat-containing protein [Bryobacteraceae bacterium]|nr:DUF4097 family beta strand repeat-containing protein [Bryobacteraceae bacterium]
MRTLAGLMLLAAALLLVGCVGMVDFGDSEAYKEDFHSTYPLTAGSVSVETFNGSIELMGWEENSVEVNATKYASTESGMHSIKIDVNATAGAVRVRATRPSDTFSHMGVRFTMRVPRKTLLELVSTSNGHLRIEDVEGRARLRTSNGAIRINRLKGDVDARTSNGAIEADTLEGNAALHTSNGSIRVEATHGTFEAGTSNGSINARLIDPATNWPVRVESSNGHVELTLQAKQLPEVRASTSNSSLVLRLPAFSNARVRAYTSHSSVTSEFEDLRSEEPDSNRGRRKHSELNGTIGSGGPLMDLSSSNGSIKILKL